MQILRNRGMGAPPQDWMRGANQIPENALQENCWPYFWEYPRANTEHVQKVASIVAPAPATVTEVLAVTVPSGFRFVLRSILTTFQTSIGGGSVFVNGSGDILWTIDVDTPVAIGSVALSGYGLPDLVNMAETRGSFENGPWRVEGFNVFNPYQTIRVKCITTVNITPGLPNTISGGLFGWWEKAIQ